jgi:putative spermidine/putrescine transport system substrate-binding protein
MGNQRLAMIFGTTFLVTASFFAPVWAADVKELRMIEAGGKSGESIDVGYIAPFSKATGIKVVRESPNPFGKLKAIVESGNVGVDLFEVGALGLAQGAAENLIEPLDWAKINPVAIYPEAKNPNGFGYQYYSTIMAWGPKAKPIKSWADFFNVKDFPGRRSMPDTAEYALTAALLADGVPPEKLYPLDVDRAFKKLNDFKKNVSVWWTAGSQPPQLLKDGEVDYAISYSGRVAGNKDGIGYTFDQGMLELSYFVVPKGANPANRDAVAKLLHEMSVAENQAEAAKVISYTGSNPQLDDLLPKDRLQEFPTAKVNKDTQLLSDTEWWFKNGKMVQDRWQEFKLGL